MASRQNILDSIKSPADLRKLTDADLGILAMEIRSKIINTTSKTGGHVASSLGAVELILALHSVLDAPKDKVLFDVGHQAYAHKLVTGRADVFETLRSYGGISGFPRPSESIYDTHPSGHASDSLSVASGLAKAKLMNGTDEKIAVVIGDAALAGGMAFEALNFIGSQQLPIVIVLNDNEMSISRNVGALMKHLGNIRATTQYRDAREAFQERLEHGGRISNAFAEFGKHAKESMKQMIIPQSMLYENLGIVCTPPIDGHDIASLRDTFKLVFDFDGPVLVHAVTKKGAGYAPAEQEAERFHGVGPYDPVTGESNSSAKGKTPTQVFSECLVAEGERDGSIVAITAAMEGGTGLKAFRKRFPERFIDVGIAEEQAVAMASGLAIGGKCPVVAIYSTFLQRAIDQIIVDVALPKLHVVFALDRAGLVGDDGPTHHGQFDIAYLRMIPNMAILAPSGAQKLSDSLHTAIEMEGPVAIRYPRGSSGLEGETDHLVPQLLEIGKSEVVREGKDVSILAFGRMVSRSIEAAEILAQDGIDCEVVDMTWVKPLDMEAIRKAAQTKMVVTVEEGIVAGGAGEGIVEALSAMNLCVPTLVLGIRDSFIMQGNSSLLLHDIGLDGEGIAASIKSAL